MHVAVVRFEENIPDSTRFVDRLVGSPMEPKSYIFPSRFEENIPDSTDSNIGSVESHLHGIVLRCPQISSYFSSHNYPKQDS